MLGGRYWDQNIYVLLSEDPFLEHISKEIKLKMKEIMIKKITSKNKIIKDLSFVYLYTYIQFIFENNKCLPESFNMNISHQLFDLAITFVNSQHYNINSKGFKRCFKDSWYTKINWTQIWYDKFN